MSITFIPISQNSMLKRLARQSSRPLAAACEASSSTIPRRYWNLVPQLTSGRHASNDSSSSRQKDDPSVPVVAQLAELVDTLSALKDQSRRPASSAYLDLIQLASQFDTFRSLPIQQGSEPSLQIPRESLGWSLAAAALADAAAGNVELPPDTYDVIASVSCPSLRTH